MATATIHPATEAMLKAHIDLLVGQKLVSAEIVEEKGSTYIKWTFEEGDFQYIRVANAAINTPGA